MLCKILVSDSSLREDSFYRQQHFNDALEAV